MASSAKTRDLLRDPRSALHSAVVDPHRGEGELQLYGRGLAQALGMPVRERLVLFTTLGQVVAV